MNKKLSLSLLSSIIVLGLTTLVCAKAAPTKQNKLLKKVTSVKKVKKQKKTVQPLIVPPSAFTVDEIKSVIYGQEITSLITQSDLDRPSINGDFRTLEDLIFEDLLVQDALKFKILPDEEEIDRHLKQVQRDNNMNEEQIRQVFSNAGYTYEEGRDQMGRMKAASTILDHKVRAQVMVPEKEVKKFYDENPEMLPAEYLLERAFVEIPSGQNEEQVRKDLTAFVAHKKSFAGVEWSPPFWIEKGDVAENKQFIYTMKSGSISKPQVVAGGFEMFRLKDKKAERVRSLEERYNEIAPVLMQPRYQKLMEAYRKELFDSASIVHF